MTVVLASSSSSARPAPHARTSSLGSLASTASVRVPLSDLVLALHDFTPSDGHATCLAFKAGDIIHVLNRDGTGWWDGELNGKRGWFPSNYTGSCEPEEPLLPRAKTPGHRSHSSVSSWNSIGTSTSAYSINASQFSVYNALEQVLKDTNEGPAVLQPLLHGISLLKSAVVSHRPPHFQPSTACIISCVRNVLIRADCLQRETPTMQANPPLAVERKRILDDLSALVAQTRACSVGADSASDEEEEYYLDDESKAQQHAKLLTHALHVYLDIETFVDVAIKSGIDFPQRRTNYQSDGDQDEEGTSEPVASGSQAQVPRPDSAMRVDASEQPLSSALASDGERSDSSAAPLVKPKSRRGTVGKAGPSTRFAGSTPRQYRASSHASSSKSKSRSVSSHAQKDSVSSVSSNSSAALSSHSGDPPSPESAPPRHGVPLAPSGPCTPSEVLGYLRTLHDDLLDCVSKFVGKVHAHVPGDSNNGWKGEMVALTSALVMKVASLVGIVDAILSAGGNTTRLRDTKEHLYVVANALVDSVKQLVASLDMSPPDGSDEEDPSETHKQQALHWATGTLKGASECETALRLAILRNLPQGARINITPSGADGPSVPVEEMAVVRKAKSLASLHVDDDAEANPAVQPEVKVEVTPAAVDTDGLRFQSRDSGVESLLSSRSRSSSSAVDSVFSVRADSESVLSDIEETRTAEDDESSLAQQTQPTKLRPPLAISLPSAFRDAYVMDALSPRSPLEEKMWRGDLPMVPGAHMPSFASVATASSFGSEPNSAVSPTAPQPPPTGPLPPPPNVIMNAEGQLMAASLEVIIERMTPHQHIVDPQFSTVFFSTFRMFTSPIELVVALRLRYNVVPPAGMPSSEYEGWKVQLLTPVRLRVLNLLRTWLEFQWRPASDMAAIELLGEILGDDIIPTLGRTAMKLAELFNARRAGRPLVSEMGLDNEVVTGSGGNGTGSMLLMGQQPDPTSTGSPGSTETPRPIMNKTLFAALKESRYGNVSPLDFDPLELARQLTVMENELFRAVKVEEILGPDTTPGNVRQLSTLSTSMTTWIVECVLAEADAKKRTAVVKFFIKVADRCMSINNFSAPRAILAALDSSSLSRLQQTWQGLDKKARGQMDDLRTLADPNRNYFQYRSRLKAAVPPAVPFLGLYLTDMTFCREGNPSMRAPPGYPDHKLINFIKYHKMTRIAQDLQRFQVPYTLKSVPEIQSWLGVVLHDAQNRGELGEMYRRSLLVEPRQPAETAPTTDLNKLRVFGWAGSLRGQPASTPS